MKIGNVGAFSLALVLAALPAVVLAAGNAENGKKIVETKSLGNCVACHVIPNMEFPGDVGPDLVQSMQGFTEKDRGTVWQWVWDARVFDPDTIMPPFGPNKFMTKKDVDDVVEYLYSFKKNK
ncbi:MAG: sulfur oxidation c-type cytochrome SoxX [Nitrospiraceae bacterium]|nr:sulfur oxidation c-type cytochrome SoxX [Nitrospiraceae bacterium]